MLTSKLSTRRIIPIVALFAVTGCGSFKLPKAAKPDELPKRARVLEAAPAFMARSMDLTEFTSSELKGKPAVVIGVDWEYASEADEWAAVLEGRFGKSGDRYRIVKLIEDRRIGVLSVLSEAAEENVDFLVSPDFGSALGFENETIPSEGPHVAVISADGILLGTTDGVARTKRIDDIYFALQGVLPPLTK